jgi:hypothetical protein
MTDLSPAAQGVKDAVLALYSDINVHKFGWQLDAPTVAAALRAVADQVAPDDGISAEVRQVLNKILAIATELENQP